MQLTFLLPAYLQPFADNHRSVELSTNAASLAEALAVLWHAYPGLRDRVVDERGQVRQFVNIFVGNDNIRDTGGLATPVRDRCEIMIVPSVAGGNGNIVPGGYR